MTGLAYANKGREPMNTKGRVNILLVDDQPGKLLTYEVMLRDLDENLIKASSAREALGILLKMDIAVVLLDVSMPEMDGFELADMIQQHPRFEETAIIFVSAVRMTDTDRLKGYQRGGVDYISVPVVPELLRAKVRVFADVYRKSRQLEDLNEILRTLSSRLIEAQDAERRRIARELHDGLQQDLAAAKLVLVGSLTEENTRATQSVTEAVEIIDRTMMQVRSLSHLLHPPLLDEGGLVCALKWYVEGLTKRSGIESSLAIVPSDFPRLAPHLETAVFRIVQECLTNTFRHAEAHKTWVTVALEADRLAVSVRDDGKGIGDGIAEFQPDRIGIGIAGMRQRVAEFGGQYKLSRANPGTLVQVMIPIVNGWIRKTLEESGLATSKMPY
jgi:signal transduction histidine kinase